MNIIYLVTAQLFVAPTTPMVPGAIDPRVNQMNIHTTICVPGYSANVRPPTRYTNALKRKQMAQYGIIGTTADFEEDHLIPLSIGGNPRDPRNLWPEPWHGQWNARMKDRLEVKLHSMVCSGQMTLVVAQQLIATNWIHAYQQYVPPTTAHKKRKKIWHRKYF